MKGEDYKIKMGRCETPGQPPLEEGWWAGHTGCANDFIYSRTPNESRAAQVSKNEAIVLITEMRKLGYPAKCVPPIAVTVTY